MSAASAQSNSGMWMGILALMGMLCVSVVAVTVVFFVHERGTIQVSAPSATPGSASGGAATQPVIINNVIPGAGSGEGDAERRIAGKPNYIDVVPPLPMTTPTGRSQRQVAINRGSALPPAYEIKEVADGRATRWVNTGAHAVVRGPLPNRVPLPQRGKVSEFFQPRFAIPGRIAGEASFAATPDMEMAPASGSAGGLKVEATNIRRSSKALKPHGYQPLKGHEFLIADLAVTNQGKEAVVLDGNSVWAAEASDPDTGYYQNHQLIDAKFPKTVEPGSTVKFTSAIVFVSSAQPGSLVVQAPEGEPVSLPLRLR